MKPNSLRDNIWFYLIIFTLLIIIFLWFFQVVFINKFYEYSKTSQIKESANKIIHNYTTYKTTDLDKISYDYDVCIELVQNQMTTYTSNNYKGCILSTDIYKQTFYNSNSEKQTYQLVNPKFDNKTLIYAAKIGDNSYLFVNASLEPLDTTVVILSKQLIIVSFIVLFLALIIGYVISKKISKPIEKMNKDAKLLASGDYRFTFNNHSHISEIDELANTLNYAKNELEHTDELRRDLLANVSHDLKTPLTMIKGYAEMVRDLTYKDKEKREENLNVIIDESDRLNGLVEDILTLSKMQANKDDLDITEFDIVELIHIILKRYDLLMEKENYSFVCEMPEKVTIHADKKKIEQVIYNLINNAINYTGRDNQVIIRVIKNTNVRVEISDTGKGIQKEDIPHIWDKYYHSKKKHKRNKIGTGLGLSIVKTILESHHFQYGVISKPNKGTTFYFETY